MQPSSTANFRKLSQPSSSKPWSPESQSSSMASCRRALTTVSHMRVSSLNLIVYSHNNRFLSPEAPVYIDPVTGNPLTHQKQPTLTASTSNNEGNLAQQSDCFCSKCKSSVEANWELWWSFSASHLVCTMKNSPLKISHNKFHLKSHERKECQSCFGSCREREGGKGDWELDVVSWWSRQTADGRNTFGDVVKLLSALDCSKNVENFV